ncbi:MAG TPA: TA system VapC family ribonuclease toxin [Tepidisphaeraceae bacterium]|jgi:toxin-antitoxin system PIN domain toxin
MILADTSVWLALSLSHHQFHKDAQNWFGEQSEEHSILFCRSTQQSFLRLVTTPALGKHYGFPSITNTQAWDIYENIISDRRCGFTTEPAGIQTRWASYTRTKSASPKLWMDAYLAAFAVTGGYKFVTLDDGFKQFDGLHSVILTHLS